MLNRLTPNPKIVGEHWKGHLGGGSPQVVGHVIDLHRAPQPRGPVPGRGVSTISGNENQEGLCPSW